VSRQTNYASKRPTSFLTTTFSFFAVDVLVPEAPFALPLAFALALILRLAFLTNRSLVACSCSLQIETKMIEGARHLFLFRLART